MNLYFPSYYKQFRCIAGACPDSCCHEWTVQVDDAMAEKYLALPGELGDALRAALAQEDGEYTMRNVGGRCPMWRDDGLCRIQAELGEEALCHVCREFPRLRQDYGDFVELGLEMSCPEAARIMLTCDGWTLEKETLPEGEEPEYDREIMEILRRSRSYAIGLMSMGEYTVPERLALLLMYGYQIQGEIDGSEPAPFDPENALEEARGFAGAGDFEAVLDFYDSLEVLTGRWRKLLHSTPCPGKWTEELCKLAAYGIYRYWYQAVSDWDLAARVKLLILHCIMARFLGGDDFNSLLDVIQLYSKEIENDSENVEAILDGAYSQSALTDRNILGLLL